MSETNESMERWMRARQLRVALAESDAWQAEATRVKEENHKLREALALVTLQRDKLYSTMVKALEGIQAAVE